MSLTEKLGSLMARPNEDLVNKDDVPVWMKYAARGAGTVGGGIAIFLGVFACLNIIGGHVDCLIAGIWQMLAGFLVIVVEAPCCCLCIDFVGSISDKVDKRPYWNRGALYVALALPPIFLCFELSTALGSGFIFGTGALYGMMAIGKKASQQEMQSNASNFPQNSTLASNLKTSLVDNAQPMGFNSNFDSNV